MTCLVILSVGEKTRVTQIVLSLLSILFIICGQVNASIKSLKKITDDLNVATEDFKELVEGGIFVDKTLMINEIIMRDEKVMQITRPRKWGKTVNLNMLRRFFELEHDQNGVPLPDERKINPPLFKGGKVRVNGKVKSLKALKIMGFDNAVSHFGKHPVIYIDLKGVKGKNYQQFEDEMRNVVSELYLSFSFLNKYLDDGSDILDVPEKIRLAQFVTKKVKDEDFVCCFEFLSLLLYKHFKSEVCLFIDNYDFPIINAFLEFGDKNREFDSIVIMLRVLFENGFKENQYLFKGVLSGTLNFFVVASGISQYDFVGFHTLLDKPFSSHYGFSQKDIGELMGRADITFNLLQLQQWYGGIHVDGQEIFNPWSVMKCLSKRGKYDFYLQNSYSTDFSSMLDRAFLTEDMQDYFNLLIEGKEIVRSSLADTVYLRSVSGDFYSVFVHAGLLERIAPDQPTDRPIWRMKIPNMDVRGLFSVGVGKWVAHELKIVDSEFERFINLLPTKQFQQFGDELQKLLTRRNLETNTLGEHFFHRLMGGLVCSLGKKYAIEIIKDSGNKRGGIAMVPFKEFSEHGFIIEYNIQDDKMSSTTISDTALENLLNNTRSFSIMEKERTHLKSISYLTFVFCGSIVVFRFKEGPVF